MSALSLECWLALALMGSIAFGASPMNNEGRFTANSNLVLINATVLDSHSRPVRGLSQTSFRLFDDKAERAIAYFGEEETPLSLAIVFDTSGSMDGKLSDLRKALSALLESTNQADEFCLITFADRPQVVVPWTPDPGAIQSAVFPAKPRGRTALLDAVQLGLRQLNRSQNARRAIVVFSDGGDNYSRLSARGLARLLEEADATLYAINTSDEPATGLPFEEMERANLLGDLCDRAGGRYFEVSSFRDSREIAGQIGKELRSHYVIGFVPQSGKGDGRFHHVQVKMMREAGSPKMSVYWRRGYRD